MSDKVRTVLDAHKVWILSVGSGDGSQAESIVKQGHHKIVVSYYDSRAEVLIKYPSAAAILEYLDSECIDQYFSVDAAALGMGTGPLGAKPIRRYDCIMFYFPHVGGDINTKPVLKANREVIRGYIRGAVHLLAEDGEIQLAVKTGGGYDRQDVENLVAEERQLVVKLKMPIDKSQFPGYVHRLTVGAHGKRADVHDRGSVLYVLELADERDSPGSSVSSLSGGGSSSDGGSTIDELVRLRGRILIVVQALAALTDEEAEAALVAALAGHYASAATRAQRATVLDLRRAVARTIDPVILPDTRQLNRVIYAMEAKGLVVRKGPQGKSQKPTWAQPPASALVACAP